MKIELPGNIFASKDNEPYCHSLMLDGFLYIFFLPKILQIMKLETINLVDIAFLRILEEFSIFCLKIDHLKGR